MVVGLFDPFQYKYQTFQILRFAISYNSLCYVQHKFVQYRVGSKIAIASSTNNQKWPSTQCVEWL